MGTRLQKFKDRDLNPAGDAQIYQLVEEMDISNFGRIEQNLPHPFLMVLIGLSGRSVGPRGHSPLVRELSLNIRLG